MIWEDVNMKVFVVDWRQPRESTTTKIWKNPRESIMTEIWENSFKFNPINITTKDGCSCEMDARIIMEIDDDSPIVKNSGSFSYFVDNTLSVLVRNFFTYKEISDIVLDRLKTEGQFIYLAQKKLVEYGVKITMFTIVYTALISSFGAKNEEPKMVTKETYRIKDADKGSNNLLIFFGTILLLTVSLGISVLVYKESVNVDYRFSIIAGIIVPILFVIITYQHFEIKKLMRMLAKEDLIRTKE